MNNGNVNEDENAFNRNHPIHTYTYFFFSSFLQENDSDTLIILFSFYSYIRNEDIYSDEHTSIQKARV